MQLPESYLAQTEKTSTENDISLIKKRAEEDFFFFVNLVSPHLQLGSCHKELCDRLTEGHKHILILFPRAHLKSTLMQHWVAWQIVKHPWITVLYISGNSPLSKSACGDIKRILTTEATFTYWPGLVNKNQNKRNMWTEDRIKTDHASRQENGVRDPTLYAIGVGSTVTGFHADLVVFDDLVNEKNCKGLEQRNKIDAAYSLGNSLLNPGGTIRAVGTYYDSNDLYHVMEELVNDTTEEKLYKTYKEVVEDKGDGSGKYLWPRKLARNNKPYGFNNETLAVIRSNYIDKNLFRSQYYNACQDEIIKAFTQDLFKDYDRKYLKFEGNEIFYEKRKLNVYTAMDFAWTEKKTSDYTAIETIGIDYLNNIYHLDSTRFKTSSTDVMAMNLLEVYLMYYPVSIGMESTATQDIIIDAIVSYCRQRGVLLPKKLLNPSKRGNKINYIEGLKAYYDNGWIYHSEDFSLVLEEELLFLRDTSVHDDVANAFRDAVSLATRPMDAGIVEDTVIINSRFGGVGAV